MPRQKKPPASLDAVKARVKESLLVHVKAEGGSVHSAPSDGSKHSAHTSGGGAGGKLPGVDKNGDALPCLVTKERLDKVRAPHIPALCRAAAYARATPASHHPPFPPPPPPPPPAPLQFFGDGYSAKAKDGGNSTQPNNRGLQVHDPELVSDGEEEAEAGHMEERDLYNKEIDNSDKQAAKTPKAAETSAKVKGKDTHPSKANRRKRGVREGGRKNAGDGEAAHDPPRKQPRRKA